MSASVTPALSGTSYSLLCTSQSEVEKPVTFYSSGSTGTKKRIYFSMADIQKILDFLPRGMNTVIDRDEARVLVFLQNSQGRGIGSILAKSLVDFGMQGWTADLQDSPEDIWRQTTEHGVNVWFGDAITIYRATKILAQEHDLRSLGMQCIFITMSNIPQSMIDYLHCAWGCRVSTHYGLTESGWGLAVDCDTCPGYHYDELDHIVEVVDPVTGEVLPDGQEGELVLTTLRKQGAPLIRYRTHDLTRIVPGTCACGLRHPRIATLTGRTDDMFKVKGCNMFPAQVEEVIKATDGTSSEYQVMIEAVDGHDVLTVLFETPLEGDALARCEEELALIFKAKLGCTPEAKGVPVGELPRSEKKTKRIFDSRY